MTESQGIGKRLNEILNELSISQNIFAEQLNITQGYLSNVFNGRKGIGLTILLSLAKTYPKVNLHWLLTGSGTMWVDPNYIPSRAAPTQVKESPRKYLTSDDRVTRIEKTLIDYGRRIAALEGGISIKMEK